MADEVKVEHYLNRIGYSGSRSPTLDVLHRLHRRHMLSVPFENLDIHLGKPIVLDQKAFYSKIVDGNRGGYCYELNGCFAWLLRKLGFRVSILSARVAGKGGFSPEFDHMALLVRLEEPWLADVGFGDSFTTPKRIDTTLPSEDHGFAYRITANKIGKLVSRKRGRNRKWEPQYAFSLRPRRLEAFAARNRYQQTSPRSHFTHGRLISKLTPSGRVTLTDSKLVLTADGRRVERAVKGEVGFDDLLEKYFRLRLS